MKNIGEAFSFIFKDPNWVTKFLIGAVFTMLSLILIGIPVLYGYCIELLQRVRRGEQYPLPEWKDVGIKFITGFKYIVTVIVYFLPMIILLVPVVLVLVIASFQGSHFQEFTGGAAIVIFIFFILIPYSLIVTLLTPIITIQFADKESISDGLRIGSVFKLFKHYWQDTLFVVLITIGIEILASIGIIFFLVGIFFTSFYVSIIRFHLYGQISQTIQESGLQSL